jgi:hypothetical protein
MNALTQADLGLIGLIFVLVFALLIFAYTSRLREEGEQKTPTARLREIPAFRKLREAINNSVEAGQRLHLTVGRGALMGIGSASALVGLSVLGRVAKTLSLGEKGPITTSGDSTLMILSQDTTHHTYSTAGVVERYDPTDGQLSGLTPFSYASGTLPVIYDQGTTATVMAGHFGTEAALIADASENTGNLTVAGSDDLSAQAVFMVTANEPLIGEELYAAGAYTQAGDTHTASLLAQDVIRWTLVGVILLGILLKLIGIL